MSDYSNNYNSNISIFIKNIFFIYRNKLLFNYCKINCYMGIGDWGLGIGDWGLGPIPNPQSPIPNPQSPSPTPFLILKLIYKIQINN